MSGSRMWSVRRNFVPGSPTRFSYNQISTQLNGHVHNQKMDSNPINAFSDLDSFGIEEQIYFPLPALKFVLHSGLCQYPPDHGNDHGKLEQDATSLA
jgi:hypothetical protein